MPSIRYKGYSNGTWFYCSAHTFNQCKILLRNQASKKFGRFNFTQYQQFTNNKWNTIQE